ncbi:hypothetical protein ACZ90_67860 [Streptomyces albus subsp. albus]|nr:hypothetical protein ACZ90_67860 [Streptomyces albus subsp. albus]
MDDGRRLAELCQAGPRLGITRVRFATALVHRSRRAASATTAAGLAANLRGRPGSPGRAAAVLVPLATAYPVGGWPTAVYGVPVLRLMYPQLAWLSLLVEHTWFDPDPWTGDPAWVEAGRCLRPYPRRPGLVGLRRPGCPTATCTTTPT